MTHYGRGGAACGSTCEETTRTHPQNEVEGRPLHPPLQFLGLGGGERRKIIQLISVILIACLSVYLSVHPTNRPSI